VGGVDFSNPIWGGVGRESRGGGHGKSGVSRSTQIACLRVGRGYEAIGVALALGERSLGGVTSALGIAAMTMGIPVQSSSLNFAAARLVFLSLSSKGVDGLAAGER